MTHRFEFSSSGQIFPKEQHAPLTSREEIFRFNDELIIFIENSQKPRTVVRVIHSPGLLHESGKVSSRRTIGMLPDRSLTIDCCRSYRMTQISALLPT